MIPDERKPRFKETAKRLFRNPTSLAGAALAAISLAYVLFLSLVMLLSKQSSPYLGMLTYLIFPMFLGLGLVLIFAGMWHERSKSLAAVPTPVSEFPTVELGVPERGKSFGYFIVFVALFIAIGAAGSYRGYQYTESVRFCGTTCHTPMHPEYTAYQFSPHARVPCTECHVGSGAGWYVRSKLSGAYQVYAVLFHKYPRPIPTPVSNMRPARDTCEQCHWSRKYYGTQLKIFYHYANDEKNTSRQVQMLIHTGGAEMNTGVPAGIHWHMNIANRITFIASDPLKQTIPWVQVKDMQGRITTYQVRNSALSPQQVEQAPKHLMDCMDCHDRPSHIFRPPDASVDESLLAGRIDASLPFIKLQGVTALAAGYATTPEAMQGIASSIQDFYKTKYPQVYANQPAAIDAAVAELQRVYQTSIFPDMKVDWRTHPNNIGHFYTPGCFRCHDGDHVSDTGKVLQKDCNTCHTALAQSENQVPVTESGGPFKHPIDIGDLTQVSCSDCHSGAVGP